MLSLNRGWWRVASGGFTGTWVSVSALSLAVRGQGGIGTGSAFLSVGGLIAGASHGTIPVDEVEEFDGSSWSASATLTEVKSFNGSCGSTSEGLTAGGKNAYSGTNQVTNCQKYNGSTWSNTGSLPTAKSLAPVAGTPSDALSIGGNISGAKTDGVAEFDGSSWSATTVLPSARGSAAGFGLSSDAVNTGGVNASDGVEDSTFLYNGTSWSSVATLSTARVSNSASGTGSDGFTCQGSTTILHTGMTATTEHFDGSAWSAGGNVIYPAWDSAGQSSQNSSGTSSANIGMIAGGNWNDAGSHTLIPYAAVYQ